MITQGDLDWWLALAPTLRWRFASTSDFPHSYVVRGKDLVDTADFARAVRVIRTFGEPGRFHRWTNIYLTSNETKWWTMGAPVDETTIINQSSASDAYGVQDAPRTAAARPAFYDRIATEYDQLYLSPQDLAENEVVRQLIRQHFIGHAPRTLDVGCGTGLLLDLGVVSSKLYWGIDPSQGMLNQLVAKHPDVWSLYPGTAADALPTFAGSRFELVCALFGAASYMEVEDWQSMVDLSKDLVILMTLRQGYLPSYWQGEDRQRMLVRAEARRLEMIEFAHHHGAERIELANEDITVIRR